MVLNTKVEIPDTSLTPSNYLSYVLEVSDFGDSLFLHCDTSHFGQSNNPLLRSVSINSRRGWNWDVSILSSDVHICPEKYRKYLKNPNTTLTPK